MFFKLIKYLTAVPKTLYFNFHYFPFSTAIRLPVIVSSRVRLEKMEGKVVLKDIGRGVVRMGFSPDHEIASWYNDGEIIFQGRADLRGGSQLWARGKLTIGAGFTINPGSSVMAMREVTIGRDVLLSSFVSIMDGDFHVITDADGSVINAPEPTVLGNRVWVGLRAMILKGSIISDNSVVAAGAIVTKPFEQANVILAGAPAKIVRENVFWRR